MHLLRSNTMATWPRGPASGRSTLVISTLLVRLIGKYDRDPLGCDSPEACSLFVCAVPHDHAERARLAECRRRAAERNRPPTFRQRGDDAHTRGAVRLDRVEHPWSEPLHDSRCRTGGSPIPQRDIVT